MRHGIIISMTGIVISLMIGSSVAIGRDDDMLKSQFPEVKSQNISSLSEYDKLTSKYDMLTRNIEYQKANLHSMDSNLQRFQSYKSQGQFWAGVHYGSKTIFDGGSVFLPGVGGLVASGYSAALDIYRDHRLSGSTIVSTGAAVGSFGLNRAGTNMANNTARQLALSRPVGGWGLHPGGRVLVPSSYIDSTLLIKQVDAYKNVAHTGKMLGYAGAGISVASDLNGWGRVISDYRKMDNQFKSNIESAKQYILSTERLRSSVADQRLSALVKESNSNLSALKQRFNFESVFSPHSSYSPSGSIYDSTKFTQSLNSLNQFPSTSGRIGGIGTGAGMGGMGMGISKMGTRMNGIGTGSYGVGMGGGMSGYGMGSGMGYGRGSAIGSGMSGYGMGSSMGYGMGSNIGSGVGSGSRLGYSAGSILTAINNLT